jgi:hypothetical protein
MSVPTHSQVASCIGLKWETFLAKLCSSTSEFKEQCTKYGLTSCKTPESFKDKLQKGLSEEFIKAAEKELKAIEGIDLTEKDKSYINYYVEQGAIQLCKPDGAYDFLINVCLKENSGGGSKNDNGTSGRKRKRSTRSSS